MYELFVYFRNLGPCWSHHLQIFSPKQLAQVLGQLDTHTQKNKVGPLPAPHPIYKINTKWIKGLDVRTNIIKLIEENMRVNLHDLGFSHDFLDLLPKAQATKDKIDELDFLKMKNSCV